MEYKHLLYLSLFSGESFKNKKKEEMPWKSIIFSIHSAFIFNGKIGNISK